MKAGEKVVSGFDGTAPLRADFSQYLRSKGFLDERDYNTILAFAKKGHEAVLGGDKYGVAQKRILVEKANTLVQGLDIKLRGDNDPRVLLFVLLNTIDVTLMGKYSGKLGNQKQRLAEAFRIAGDIESRNKLVQANSSMYFPK